MESRRKRQNEWVEGMRHRLRREFPGFGEGRIERMVWRRDAGRVWRNWSVLSKIIVGNLVLVLVFVQYRVFSWVFERGEGEGEGK